jgi:hypothetical protein
MTDKLTINLIVDQDKNGKFYYSLDGGNSLVGYYDTEDEASEAAMDFLGDSIAQATKISLLGK